MPVDRNAVLSRLRAFEFSELFTQELGWDWFTATATISVAKAQLALQGIAEKRGVQIFHCPPGPDGRIPGAAFCDAAARQVAKLAREHLLIFTDAARTEQLWLYPRREHGKPVRSVRYRFAAGSANELLFQKLSAITFSLNEEEGLSLLGVTQRLKDALDRDVVTKTFYKRFEKERDAFQEFLDGIPDANLERWYVAVMLNRLMFIYFIQEKGFLGNGDPRYLQNHLAACRGNYYRDFLCPLFFQGLALSDETRSPEVRAMLGQVPYLNGGIFEQHEIERAHGRTIQVPNEAFIRLFGFFDEWNWHLDDRPIASGKEINPEILGYIFEKFINQKQMGAYYTKEDITEYIGKNTILPYVLDAARAKCRVAFEPRGADVPPASTDSTPTPSVWDLLRADPDRYIYSAVRHGVDLPLPPEIEAGVNPPTLHDPVGDGPVATLEARKGWNKPAPPEYALPTETWREVVARRQRCAELRAQLAAPKVDEASRLVSTESPEASRLVSTESPEASRLVSTKSPEASRLVSTKSPEASRLVSTKSPEASRIAYDETRRDASSTISTNDLITLNLDIRQFVQDVVVQCEGPDLLRALWGAVSTVTVLDPTCGSGAFLFAALNLLEPLYESCLDRMEAFLQDEAARHDPAKFATTAHGYPLLPRKKFADFTALLERVAAHPNRRYFVLKNIILNNLYGVDIMEEAVEICKLRLFLTLAAQVEPDPAKPNLGIEPLPDVDFNIRTGNTLVGYATPDEVRKSFTEFSAKKDQIDELVATQGRLLLGEETDAFQRFDTLCADVQQAFDGFRRCQTAGDDSVPEVDKRELQRRLAALDDELNRHLAGDYGVKPTNKTAYAKWLASHQPFHWFIHFYGILSRGGFDAVIGNPPYLECSKVTTYGVKGYDTLPCNNLYALTVERSFQISHQRGRSGMIIPVSAACADAFAKLRDTFAATRRAFWLSHYSNRPGQLFIGAQNRLTIYVCSPRHPHPENYSTRYHRWDAKNGERGSLFSTLRFNRLGDSATMFRGLYPKTGVAHVERVLNRIWSSRNVEFYASRSGAHDVYWVRVRGYFCQFLLAPPMARSIADGVARVRGEVLSVAFPDESTCNAVHAFLNSSLYYLFYCVCTDTRHINPTAVKAFPLNLSACSGSLIEQFRDLSCHLAESCRQNTSQCTKSGLKIDSVDSRPSKPILDQIDTLLAKHYGFTEEELDFIINYDIKYRMGRDAGEASS